MTLRVGDEYHVGTMSYDAVLFDFDGVIVERPTSEALYDALRRTVSTFGGSRPRPETLRAFLTGEFGVIAGCCRRLDVDTDAFCAQVAREVVRAQRRELERGVRSVYEDVSILRSIAVPSGIVSDNHPAVIAMLLDRLGLDSAVEVVFGCPLTPDGFERRKPNAANIIEAMAALDAETALYVGDRSVDVRTAENAGIDSAIVARGDDPVDPSATYHLPSLRRLPSLLE
ncbi:HAD-superfamily hydrolase [Halovivax asiaticus JCM 14624]|uniref:HAD-superfamily hydrolase n=2 Tax=Halovivax asiaticus TaxID=332953 RepID=M0BEJ7_9EURY|nr:HAD-superfamily hydrolase [Halovivax asiaticus JCM 14624]